jgi:hypothetical protein
MSWRPVPDESLWRCGDCRLPLPYWRVRIARVRRADRPSRICGCVIANEQRQQRGSLTSVIPYRSRVAHWRRRKTYGRPTEDLGDTAFALSH